MRAWWARLKELRRYPSAVIGLSIIVIFMGISIYTVIAIPYSEAIRLWQGGPGVWDENPKNARPVWVDLFVKGTLPRTIVVRSEDGGIKRVEPLGEGRKRIEITLPFDYGYDGFPKELNLFLKTSYEGQRPRVSIFWRTPDGRTITLQEDRRARPSDTYHISQDGRLRLRLGMVAPEVGLFTDPTTEERVPLKGRYELVITGEFEENADLEAKLVVYGQVHGLAGTDHLRRDLMIALLWGAPLAFAFGILGAVGAQVSTFVLAGIGTWFGGKVDGAFQRITEVNMILPVLPILMMIGMFYSRSIWLMLGLIILLNVFSASMKTYRAMLLQAKELPYIEAAQAYGAGNFRIIFRYLLPRIVPTLLPQFILVIPSFVFLEASLAVVGLGDPVLPTWGKVLYDARAQGALYMGHYYWVLEPSILLMLTGFGFALVGFTLDRVFNPRLRTV